MKIRCTTLFDITATGVTGHFRPGRTPFHDRGGKLITDIQSWNHSRNQQRNWETVTQLIGLRTQIEGLTDPVQQHDRWTFDFESEIQEVFALDQDPLGLLKKDCEGVPMILGLEETASVSPVLEPGGNIWFECVSINN